ncbi:MAG: glycosyltransferase family 4 protein [Bacteroidota bacterium]|nr:glycosyltransferase family 4 protein [Bacteroidota bacterium]
MKVLFYYPSNKRTIAFNSVMKELKARGYDMYLLTTCEEGVFHEDCRSLGIKVFSNSIKNSSSLFYYLRQILFLIRFCKKNQIEVVLSNLQHTNFIAVFAQYFIKSKVVIYRHHFNYINLLTDELSHRKKNRNESFFDKVINRRAKKIVVPSLSVKEGMVKYEHANPEKIFIMQYLYDFSMYNKPDLKKAVELKEKYRAKLIILMCARLIKLKGHDQVFRAVNKIIKEQNADIKMLVLDEGPQKTELEEFIVKNQLQSHIFMLGYCNDIVSIMAACDLMIHPSLTEASNSAVKEMALQGKTSVVCNGVGDFSDYFINRENGFLIDPNNAESEIFEIIADVYQNKAVLSEMGAKLRNTVTERFGVTDLNVNKYIESFKN